MLTAVSRILAVSNYCVSYVLLMIVISNCGMQPKTDNSASNGMQSTQDHRNESRSNPGLKTKEFDGNECVKGVATNNEEGSVGARFGQLFNSVVSVFRGIL